MDLHQAALIHISELEEKRRGPKLGTETEIVMASPVTIGGRQAFVEEKRSTNSRGSNRGRFQSGRGSGFRNEGVRGRGGHGGGRGYNRGDFNYRSEFGNRGGNRGGSANRDGYQRSESINSNGGGRANRAAGMANGNTKNPTPHVPACASRVASWS